MKKFFLLLALLASPLYAADQKFTFALPDLEGRISLGVFTEHGKLVRTLFVGATHADFTVGLNGLITTWDGKNEAGVPVPPGKYQVRGFVVGDTVKAEGEAYHFNDWIEDENSPRIVKVEDFQRIDRGFVLLARIAGNSLSVVRYDLEKGFLWEKGLPYEITRIPSLERSTNRLSVGDGVGVALGLNTLQCVNLDTGDILVSPMTVSGSFTAIAASGNSLLAAEKESLRKFALPGLAGTGDEKAPADFAALTWASDRKIGASSTAPEVWISQGSDWEKIPTGVRSVSVSAGLKDTFWLAGAEEKGGACMVGQFNPQGELLRAYRGDFVPEQVRASNSSEEISVLEKKDSVERLRQMSLVDRPGGGTEWEISFEKSITPCARFGMVGGALVADAGDTPQRGTMEFPLTTGGLTPSSPKLTVQLASDSTGLWLETASKLKLVRLADQLHADRFVLVPGENKTSMTAYAGDGVVVAEYLVTGLDAIAEIDAGEIEIP